MDVSFTNVLEGARQYFQGLPAPSSTVATSGPTDSNHVYSGHPSKSATTPTSSDSRYDENKPEGVRDPNDAYWSSTNPNELRAMVEPYAPQPTRVLVPDTRPDDGRPECNGSPGTSLTEMQPPNRPQFQRHQPDHQQPLTVTTINSAASPSPQLHQMEPPKSHSPPVYQQLNNVVRSSSYRASEMLNSHSTYPSIEQRPPSTPTVAQRTTQYYPRYHHPDITKSTPAPFSQSSIYQSPQPATSTPSRTSPVESNKSTTIPHRRNSQSEQPPGASVYSAPQTLYPNNIRGHQHLQTSSNRPAGLSNSHSQPQILHHPPDGSHSSTAASSNPCSPRNGSQNHIPSPHNHPGHIPSPHLPVASVAPPSSLSSAHTMSQQQFHPSRVNTLSYPSRVSIPYSGSSSMTNPPQQQMLPPSSSANYHPTSPHESNHHASSSSQKQSPHVIPVVHNAHAIPPHHTTPSPHHAPSPHNTGNFQPHSPTYPPPPSPHNTTNFQPHSPTYPPPPSPRNTTNFQPQSPTYPPPSARGPTLYTVPATPQHHRVPTSYPSTYPTHQQATSYQKTHSYPTNPQSSGHYPQNSRSQYGQPQSSIPSPLPAPVATSDDVNGVSYHTPTSKSTTYNGVDPKRGSIPTNQATTSSSAASASPSFNSYRMTGAVQRNTNTHNLPITAVSSYHSNRREAVGKAQTIPRPQRAPSMSSNSSVSSQPPSSLTVLPPRIPEYSQSSSVNTHSSTTTSCPSSSNYSTFNNHHSQQNYRNYATTVAPSLHPGHNSSSNTTVTSITTDTRPTAVTVNARPSSNPSSRSTTSTASYPSQRTPDNYGYKEFSYSSSLPASQPSSRVSSPLLPPQVNGLPLRKRESPLDLSVKTVKTSADSTARDDLDSGSTEKQVSSSSVVNSRPSNLRGMLPPPVQPAGVTAAAPYVTYDSRNTNGARNPVASSLRPFTPQMPVCAPKVDFLPNFNSTPLRHHQQQQQQPHQPSHIEQNMRRNTVGPQQLYVPPQHSNSMPLPHMSTFKKSSLPNNTPLYDNKAALPYPSMNESSSARPSLRYPSGVDLSRVPVHEYPSETKKYYLDGRNKYPMSQARDRSGVKRPGEPIYVGGDSGGSKQPRTENWKLAIDKEIQQKLEVARVLHEQQKIHEMSLPRALPNGTIAMPPAFNPRSDCPTSRHLVPSSISAFRDKRIYSESKSPRDMLYSHPMEKSTQPQSGQTTASQAAYPTGYRQGQRSPYNSTQSLDQPSNTGADKRVLSLLRNSLENKQQREEQLNSQQPILVNHNQQSFQNKVVAPVEPKTNIGRHNLSPFTAASLLERNSNTPPHYKFHVPRAVDSITQETPRSLYGSRVNSSATLPAGKEALLGPRELENQIHRDKDDSLAAILAAKIRTKAELKQVGTGQFTSKPILLPSQDVSAHFSDYERIASTSTPQSTASSGGSPPKLTREKTPSMSHRRRLFSRSEEENMPVAATIPAPVPIIPTASVVASRTSGFRSSSETSVFDFKESDSEGEMPVLERQTLEEMRRDRKQLSKVQPPVSLDDAMCIGLVGSSDDLVKIELRQNDNIIETDPFWTATCDKFIEQLRSGDATQKKRGRKRKIGDSSTKIDDIDDESKESSSNNHSIVNSNDLRTGLVVIKPEDIKQEVDDEKLNNVKDSPPSPSHLLVKPSKIDTEETIMPEVKVKDEEVEAEEDEDDCNNSGNDSDELPLIKRATKKERKRVESDCDEEILPKNRQIRRGSRIKLESSSASESSSVEDEEDDDDDDESDASTEVPRGSSVAQRLRARKRSGAGSAAESEGMKLRSRDMGSVKIKEEKTPPKTPTKGSNGRSNSVQKPKPKPLFGDGSDFRPGWEEEVYVYKKSLRMPPRLISVSKPSQFLRLSTSLPDLDPGSPALSASMDSSDVCLRKVRAVDSDVDSNYSFSIAGLGITNKIDDEEATSSTIISCPPKTNSRPTKSDSSSIVDLLARKVGGSGSKKETKRKSKDKIEKVGSKVLPKGSNEPELLATPSLSQLLTNNDEQSSKQQKGGKTPIKNNKSPKSINLTESCLLGYFRKETVNNFRNTFKNNHALPNEFSTFVLKSRTRTETKVLKKQATIREVFGEDRPASAPPMQNHAGDTSQDDDSQTETNKESILGRTRTLKQKVVSRLRNVGILRSHKALVNSKRHLLTVQRRKVLLKSLTEKKLENLKKETEESGVAQGEEEEEEEDEEEEEEEEGEVEVETNEPDADNNDETEIPSKKKLKLRSGRRKFRSGFDYIRKKKKPLKKDESGIPKERKRQVTTPRPNPESIADIQAEIRAWVIKKGVGETMLHRAARLGYSDVTAYCLEKLNSAPGPKDNAGYTPLHEACSRGHLEIAKLLLAYGANVSESANGGIRPLHEAAENGATELVRLLLSYGADPLLATYAGQTPLTLAADTDAYSLLEQHLNDVQGRSKVPWSFSGPSKIFDLEETGYNPLDDPPSDICQSELDEVEMEVSETNLPVLFSLANDPDKWVLLQDLMAALKFKSRDALLRQINPKAPSGPPTIAHRNVMKEFKLPDFLEKSRCCHLLSAGERINIRGSKVTLIKYNDRVRALLNVERVVISLR